MARPINSCLGGMADVCVNMGGQILDGKCTISSVKKYAKQSFPGTNVGSLNFNIAPDEVSGNAILVASASSHRQDNDNACLSIELARNGSFLARCHDEGTGVGSPALHCQTVIGNLLPGNYSVSFNLNNPTCGTPSFGPGTTVLHYRIVD